MRITRKKYEKAKQQVEAAREQLKIAKTWEEAVGQIDQSEAVDAITINDDGSVRYELVHKTNGKGSVAEPASPRAGTPTAKQV